MDCRIKGLSARAWLVVGLLALQAGLVGQAHAEPAADEHELGVTRTVVGILGYTR